MNRKQERTWGKWATEIGYNVHGWRPFLHALREHYVADDQLPSLIEDDKNKNASMPLGDYFVNLALIHQDDQQAQERHLVSAPATTMASVVEKNPLEQRSLYQSFLGSGEYKGIDELFGSLDDRKQSAGWVCITGCAGTGKSTILQYIAHYWGKRTLWRNRFDFVFPLKLNLLSKADFMVGKIDPSVDGDLAWLIYNSLGKSSDLSVDDIGLCLKKYHNTVLLLLDGFDEIEPLYVKDEHGVGNLIDFIMRKFTNGIVTSRPGRIPSTWMNGPKPRFFKCFENIGLTEDDVVKYVRRYFERQSPPQSPDTLIAALSSNVDMMRLAQTPVNIAAICFSWEEAQKLNDAAYTNTAFTMTKVYQRVILTMALRHQVNRIGKFANDLDRQEIPEASQAYIQRLTSLAYDAFSKGETQTLSAERLKSHIPDVSILVQIREQFGILRKMGDSTSDYGSHYFVHLTYQEYFAALYMAQQLAMEECTTDHDKERQRRKTIHHLANKIREDRNKVRFTTVFTFLSGLLSTDQYAAGAKYFWDAWLPALSDTPSIQTLGLHPHLETVRTHQAILREALVTHKISGSQKPLPQRLKTLAPKYQDFLQWTFACQNKAMQPLWDEEFELTPRQKKQKAFQDQRQWQQQQYSLHSLGVTDMGSLSMTRALIDDSHEETLQALRQDLGDSNPTIRREAIYAFGFGISVPEETILETIRNALHDSDSSVRRSAYDALTACVCRIVPSQATAQAIRMALTEAEFSDHVRSMVLFKRKGLIDEATLQSFRDNVSHRDKDIRQKAITLLGKMDALDGVTLQTIQTYANAPESDDFSCAIDALGDARARDKVTLQVLQNSLNNVDWSYKIERILKVLVKIGTKDEMILKAIRNKTNADDVDTCIAAINALSEIGAKDKETLQTLRHILRPSSLSGFRTEKAAAIALGRLGAPDAETLQALRYRATGPSFRADHPDLRASAIEALGCIGASDKVTLDLLCMALQDKNPLVRTSAVKALMQLDSSDEHVLQTLRITLLDSQPAIRYRAAFTLGQAGAADADTLQVLRNAVRDGDKDERLHAINVLGEVGVADEATLQSLRCALSDDPYGFCRPAADALLRLCPTDEQALQMLRHHFVEDGNDSWYASSLKHMANHLYDKDTILALLDKEAGSKQVTDNDAASTISIALLRIPPAAYAAMPELTTHPRAQRAFIASIWLHGSTVIIKENALVVDGKSFALSCSFEQQQAFTAQLVACQKLFFEAIEVSSSALFNTCQSLIEPINLGYETAVLDEIFLTIALPTKQEDEWKSECRSLKLLIEEVALDVKYIKNRLLPLENRLTQLEQRMGSIEAVTVEQQNNLDIERKALRKARETISALQLSTADGITQEYLDQQIKDINEFCSSLESHIAQLDLRVEDVAIDAAHNARAQHGFHRPSLTPETAEEIFAHHQLS